MCLTLGGGQNMCEPVVPPTPKGKEYRTYLMILGFVHMALSVMLCFIVPMQGIYELIDVAILFCALAQMNYCCLIIYIINISINFVTIFNMLGLKIQTGTFADTVTSNASNSFAMTIFSALCVFYVVANVVCFLAYREFKGMLFDAGMGGNFGMGRMGGMGGGSAQQQQARAGSE